MSTIKYKGYTAHIEFDEEDGVLFGKIGDIADGVHFHGKTDSELWKAFREAVDEYLVIRTKTEIAR